MTRPNKKRKVRKPAYLTIETNIGMPLLIGPYPDQLKFYKQIYEHLGKCIAYLECKKDD